VLFRPTWWMCVYCCEVAVCRAERVSRDFWIRKEWEGLRMLSLLDSTTRGAGYDERRRHSIPTLFTVEWKDFLLSLHIQVLIVLSVTCIFLPSICPKKLISTPSHSDTILYDAGTGSTRSQNGSAAISLHLSRLDETLMFEKGRPSLTF
jgi:hypothetical protein